MRRLLILMRPSAERDDLLLAYLVELELRVEVVDYLRNHATQSSTSQRVSSVYNETTSVYCSKHCVSQKHVSDKEERRVYVKKGKGSPYSIPQRSVPELIPVLGSQPAGDESHKPGGRLPLLSARPVVTFTTLKSAATSFVAW